MALRAVTSNGVAITPSSLTVSGTLTGSSGTATAASISPTINQSGTAGYTALDINPTETATGSGTKLLQRWAVGGSEVGRLQSNSQFFATGINALGIIGFAAAYGGAADITFLRDAADTLALRRGTNAQTFRIYNTYTDASNYERGFVGYVSNVFTVRSENAGTGVVRNMSIGPNGTGSVLLLRSAGTDSWQLDSSGNFIAQTDNTYDIGASGANRPRNVYIGGSTVIGAFHTVGVSTVADLPAAAGAARAQIFVSDSSVAAAGNFGAIVVGGGANIVPVFCDGTNWRIG